jgi:hypothetical protein
MTDRNAEPDCLVIQEYDVLNVEDYTHWLYTGKIPTSRCARKVGTKLIWLDLVKAYVFGEEINDLRYQQVVIENMAHLQKVSLEYPPVEAFSIIYVIFYLGLDLPRPAQASALSKLIDTRNTPPSSTSRTANAITNLTI